MEHWTKSTLLARKLSSNMRRAVLFLHEHGGAYLGNWNTCRALMRRDLVTYSANRGVYILTNSGRAVARKLLLWERGGTPI